MKSVEIDRSKPLADEPHTGHNRWHPDLTPVLEVDEGEEVVLPTRDALDGQFDASTTVNGLREPPAGADPSAHGTGLREGRGARRSAGGGVPGHPAGTLGLHVHPPRPGLPAGPVRGPLHGPLDHRRRLGDVAPASPACASRARRSWACRALRRRTRRCGAGRSGSRTSWAGAASSSRPTPTVRCPRPAPPPPTGCGPSRRGRTAATSTSSSSPAGPSCCCRCRWTARCSRRATATSPRATARCA